MTSADDPTTPGAGEPLVVAFDDDPVADGPVADDAVTGDEAAPADGIGPVTTSLEEAPTDEVLPPSSPAPEAADVTAVDPPTDEIAPDAEAPVAVTPVRERRHGAWTTVVSFDPDTGQELVVHRCPSPPADLRAAVDARIGALRALADPALPVTASVEVEHGDEAETLVVVERAPAGSTIDAVVAQTGKPPADAADAVLEELTRAFAHAESAGFEARPMDAEDVYWLADGGIGVVGQVLPLEQEDREAGARSALGSWARVAALLSPPVRFSDRWLPGRTPPPMAKAIAHAGRTRGPGSFAELDDLLHEEAPSPREGAGGSVRRGLVAAAGLLLLGALGLVIIGGLVNLNDDAGGATVTDAVVLQGRTARTAAPREQHLDPFADVVFFRVADTNPVQVFGDAGGGGGVVGTVSSGSLVASDDQRDTVQGFEWVHVHEPLSGSWGWVLVGRLRPV